jgi:hypothetical protein
MKPQEAEILAGAGAIAHAVIMASKNGWSVYLYGDEFVSVARTDAVEVTRGQGVIREWSSIDSAHKWIRELPKSAGVKVSIDG